MVIAKKAILCGNRAADRINRLDIMQRAVGGMNQGVRQSFAAVGKRQSRHSACGLPYITPRAIACAIASAEAASLNESGASKIRIHASFTSSQV